MRTEGSEEYRNHRNGVECVRMCKVLGIELLRLGLEYFCPDYVSKNGVSVTECNIHAQSGSPKVFSTLSRKMSNVCICDVLVMTAMVSFTAQTCAVPPHMTESTYRTFILSSTKALAVIRIALMNSSVWS